MQRKFGLGAQDVFNPDGVAAAALGASEYQGLWDRKADGVEAEDARCGF